jgi:hypothetical protein
VIDKLTEPNYSEDVVAHSLPQQALTKDPSGAAFGLGSAVLAGAAFLVVLLPAVALAYFHRDLPSLGAYHDDGIYLVTAKAIADGRGYRVESLPDERWQSKYPPIFPLLLAAVWRISPQFPANAMGFLMVAWAALPILLLLQARMLVALEFRLADQAIACLAILAYQGTLLLSVTLLSDLWFCCEVLLVIWLAERASEPGAHWKTAGIAGLAAAIAYLTKCAGIVLFGSVICVMVYKRRWRNVLVFGAVFGPVIGIWSGWSIMHSHPVSDYNDIFYSSYFKEFAYKTAFAELLARLPGRANEFALHLGSVLIPQFLSGAVFDWLRRLTVIIGVAGIMTMFRSGKIWHYVAFAVLYVAEMCIWPSPLFPRYVLPVVPLLIAGLLTLPRNYWPEIGRSQHSMAPRWEPLVTGLLVYFYFVQCFQAIQAATILRGERQSLEQAYTWISHNVPADASMVAFRDPVLYLYSGLHAEGLHSSGLEGVMRCLNIADFARRRGHRYVVIGPKDPEFDVNPTRAALSSALQSDRRCRQVYSAEKVDIYDVTAEAQ